MLLHDCEVNFNSEALHALVVILNIKIVMVFKSEF